MFKEIQLLQRGFLGDQLRLGILQLSLPICNLLPPPPQLCCLLLVQPHGYPLGHIFDLAQRVGRRVYVEEGELKG